MNEQAPTQYHPEVEKALETSGPDVGRVKDIEIAHTVAEGIESASEVDQYMIENGFATEAENEERREKSTNTAIKVAIAQRAVDSAAKTFLHNIVATGVNSRNGDSVITQASDSARGLVDTAKRVASDYDGVQDAAKSSREVGKL